MIGQLKAWLNTTFRRNKIDGIIKELHFTRHLDASFDAKVRFDCPGIDILVGMMVQAFESADGINYVDFSAVDPASLEVYTLSIQRQNGLKPADVNRILRSALVRIIEMDHYRLDEYMVARDALIECDYVGEDGIVV